MTPKVLKFGGRCVGDAGMIGRSVAVIAGEKGPRIVVTSAMAGVTDRLLEAMDAVTTRPHTVTGLIATLRGMHQDMLVGLVQDRDRRRAALERIDVHLTKMERLLYGVHYTEELTPRTRDHILSFGERMAVHLLAAALNDRGVPAVALEADEAGIYATGRYGSAVADLELTAKHLPTALAPHLEKGVVPVIAGYFGKMVDGHVGTFGRSGTDYSAAVVAYAMKAPVLEVWKEVDGFMSADPKVVPEAFIIDQLSYEEAAELAYFGAQVLHPRAVEPAQMANVTIYIRNIMTPEAPGTRISGDGYRQKDVIKSVSYRRLATVKISGAGCGNEIGTMERISACLREAHVNILSATTSQTCIAILVERPDVARAELALHGLVGKGPFDRVEAHSTTALVCAVGEGLGHTKGLAARVFTAVAKEHVNVHLISAGASMVAYHFTVEDSDLEKTLLAIHREFFGDRRRQPPKGALPA